MPSPSEVHDLIPQGHTPSSEEGIDLLAILVMLLAEWRLGIVTFLLVGIGAVLFVFSIKPQYAASATILPQQGHAQATSLSSLFSSRGGAGALYLSLLKSRSVQDITIDRAHLLSLFHTSSYESARGVLSSKTTLTDDGTTVRISVRDANAANAALIANSYIDALSALNENMALEDSTKTRSFFEKQLDQERGELAHAEVSLEKTETQTGLIQPEAQTAIGINAIAQTRAQITNLEVQLSSLRESATEQNPEVHRLETQLAQLRTQEATLEAGSRTPVGAAPSAAQIPATNLDVARAEREVKYHDALVESLASQYERASLDQSFSHQEFQVIDRAVVPEHKDWPPRKPFLLFGIGLAAFAGFFMIVVKLVMRRILRDPANQQSLTALRAVFGRH